MLSHHWGSSPPEWYRCQWPESGHWWESELTESEGGAGPVDESKYGQCPREQRNIHEWWSAVVIDGLQYRHCSYAANCPQDGSRHYCESVIEKGLYLWDRQSWALESTVKPTRITISVLLSKLALKVSDLQEVDSCLQTSFNLQGNSTWTQKRALKSTQSC